MALLTVSDLSLFLPDGRVSDGQLAAMISDVEALAVQAAPCLTGPLSEAQAAAALARARRSSMRVQMRSCRVKKMRRTSA